MGMCCQRKELCVTSQNLEISVNQNMSATGDTQDDKFKDMPEWEGNKIKGLGIKKMKGYKCCLKIDELNSLREEFWRSKHTHKDKWKILYQACVYDHIKAEEFLYRNNIKTVYGCINECTDSDKNYYKIPNFCINDPYYELELLPEDTSHNNMIEIILIDMNDTQKMKLTLNEATLGKDVKKMFCENKNINIDEYNIRLFFGGGIINDDETLYQHKIKNKYTIQVNVNKK